MSDESLSATDEVMDALPVRSGLRRRLDPRTKARTTAALLAILSLLVGLGIVVFDGFFNRYPQFRIYWITLGIGAFYAPGVGFGLAWWGLRAGRTWALRLGMVAAAWQGLLALAGTTFFAFFASPFSIIPVLEGLLWTAADFIFVYQLRRALPWVMADAEAQHGFAVEPVEAV